MASSFRAALGLAVLLGAHGPVDALPASVDGPEFAVGSAGPYAITPQDEPHVSPWAGREQIPAEPPGWFVAANAGLVKSHVGGDLVGGGGLPFGDLSWMVEPRIEVGYRLPDGAGDLRIGYQFLTTSGSDGTFPGGLSTRLNVQSVDLDYVSAEWLVDPTPGLFRGLRAVAGVRFVSADLRSTGLAWEFHNQMCGAGPRMGFEWTKSLPARWPVEAYVRVEGTGLAAETKQTIGYTVATPRQWSGAAAILTEIGLSWWPVGTDRLHLVAGYHLEQWWNLGRTDLANVDLSVNGVFIRAEWKY